MNFTDEQFNALAPFEPRFTTLIRSHYVSYVGFGNAKRIDTILKEAGLQPAAARTNYACAECVKRLVEKAARAWFDDKQARFEAAIAARHYDDLDVFVRKYEITYDEAKAAAERIGVEVVDGKVPGTMYEEICQEIREHVLGLPGGFNADGLTLDEIHEAKAAAEAAKEPVEECDENTVPRPKKSTKKSAKK